MSVSILSTVLTVNPAFLEEIKDSNHALWDELAGLRSACSKPLSRPEQLHCLVRSLNEVRDLLALQFALEESYGYIEVPVRHERAMNDLVDQLKSQHCVLYLTASELAESSEELQYRGCDLGSLQRLVSQVQQFDLQLVRHEQRERELIEESRVRRRRTH